MQLQELSLLEQHAGEIELVGDVSSKKKTYRCLHCGYDFQTKLSAMLDHIAQHKADDYIKVYEIRRGENAGAFRPEHHAKESTGRDYGGTDTKLSCFIIPDSFEQEAERVWCRFCSAKSWPVCDLYSNQKLGSTVRFIRAHEEKCRKKKLSKLKL